MGTAVCGIDSSTELMFEQGIDKGALSSFSFSSKYNVVFLRIERAEKIGKFLFQLFI